MIKPDVESVLAIKTALKAATGAAYDFCKAELLRVPDDEYVAVITDVRWGYTERIHYIDEQVSTVLDYVDTICNIMAAGQLELRPDWVEILARNKKPVGIELRKFMAETVVPQICDLCTYIADCSFPASVVEAHERVRQAALGLQSVVEEFVGMQERYRERNHNRAYSNHRYNEIMNRIYKI